MKMKYVSPEATCIRLETEEVLLLSGNPLIPESTDKSGEDAKEFGGITLF